MLVEVEIANWRKIVELRIAIARSFQFSVRFLQLPILHLKFDLMHLQIMNQPPQLRFVLKFLAATARFAPHAPSRKRFELSP